jgi:NIPSNAP
MTTMRRVGFLSLVVFALGFAAGQVFDITPAANAQGRKVFELRTYTAPEGKLPNLLTRFRDHTLGFFKEHGMENVGYWVPQDAPASGNTLIYILAHDSREAATKSWDAFRQHPDWIKVRDASQVDGVIVSNVQSVFMEATDFSPTK